MGVGEVAHHEESPLGGAEISLQVHPSLRHPCRGREGGSISREEPTAGVSRPEWISEKACETPAGRGDVESW